MAPVAELPVGRVVELPGRGSTYVIDSGPSDGPTFVMLHAIGCTGLLTWYPALELMRQFGRVVVFDQRWHGSGITAPRFLLEDCADDVVALADELGIDMFVPVGFSMGSLVAQLVWRRHPHRVDALVLCAAAAAFGRAVHERLATGLFAALLDAFSPAASPGASAPQHGVEDSFMRDSRWAIGQFRATGAGNLLRALAEMMRFNSLDWVSEIDVPTSVVIPQRDRCISPRHQHWIARQISGAATVTVDAGHACCTLQSDAFLPGLQTAVELVASRITTVPPRAVSSG